MKSLPFLIVLLAVIGCKQTETTKPAVNSATAETPNTVQTESAPDASITLEKFNRLKTGMTYAETVKILDAEGEVLSESEIAGTKTVMYQWRSDGFGNMNAMFQNGKLVQKSQFGLK